MDRQPYTIYAVGFDGTLCEGKYPNIETPMEPFINQLIELKKHGDKIILWSCREGELLNDAVEWCREHGLEFDAINDNLPEMIELWGNNPRKVYADVYIDDKATDMIFGFFK